ncbi:hypothetical protein B0H63DRAFT_515955 [Podospora didyma]|uniref:Uncharacterized protein n=1 Tax=Podospora didyma TaxID=330526 RepID=A0AAE0U6Z0_9PEZI|nr:hypothetical protein B0H63DRAFT_515955 [Podospora didyma]
MDSGTKRATSVKPENVKVKKGGGFRVKGEFDYNFSLSSIPLAPGANPVKKDEKKVNPFSVSEAPKYQDFGSSATACNRAARHRRHYGNSIVFDNKKVRVKAHYDRNRSQVDFTALDNAVPVAGRTLTVIKNVHHGSSVTGEIDMSFSVDVRKFRGVTSSLSLLSNDPTPSMKTGLGSNMPTFKVDKADDFFVFGGSARNDENKVSNCESKPAISATPAPVPAPVTAAPTPENGTKQNHFAASSIRRIPGNLELRDHAPNLWEGDLSPRDHSLELCDHGPDLRERDLKLQPILCQVRHRPDSRSPSL